MLGRPSIHRSDRAVAAGDDADHTPTNTRGRSDRAVPKGTLSVGESAVSVRRPSNMLTFTYISGRPSPRRRRLTRAPAVVLARPERLSHRDRTYHTDERVPTVVTLSDPSSEYRSLVRPRARRPGKASEGNHALVARLGVW